MSITLVFTLVLNALGMLAPINKVSAAEARPKMSSVEMVDKNPTVGTYPTLKLTSKGSDKVQYSVYLYSPSKKVWENVSGGYTTSVAGNTTYTMKLTKPLHEGENSFSVWVKKAGASPIDKGGYDDFQSYKVTVKASSSSQEIPSIKSALISSDDQKVGAYPSLKVSSNGSGNVQYRVYLYSQSKKVWEDVTGGYTAAVNATSTTTLKLNKPLHEGENSFSVWVKRAGKDPVKKEGYDDFLSYKINVKESSSSNELPSIKSAIISSSDQKVGIKPTMSITSTGSENVEYRVYLYSPSKKVWEDVSGGYTSAKNPQSTTNLLLNSPLHEGENSFSIWVKRAGKDPAKKEGYDNFLSYKINVNKESSSNELPSIKSAIISSSDQKVGIKPTMSIISTGSENVEYRVYLYSPSKKVWEDVSGGYTSAKNPQSTTNLLLNSPLHEGENSFSIWVKRAGKDPAKKEGYDNFLSYKINVTEKSNTIPQITGVTVESSQITLGGKPSITIKSSSDVNVQYRVYLYSQSKEVWEDVTGGYTEAVSPTSATIKTTGELKPGRNKYSIWVKRAGYSPSDPGGYDSYVHEVVDVSMNTDKTSKISNVTANSNKTAVGVKPEINVTASAGDGSNISYKAFLFSNSSKQWIEASSYTDAVKSGQQATITLNVPLEAGTNKIMVWAKRAWFDGNVYEDYKVIEVNAVKPAPMKKKIVVDPGHGGVDPGALSPSGTKERDIALIVSTKVGDILKSNGYEVLYTRTSNTSVNWDSSNQNASLKYRYTFANSNGADLYVSVHCNSGGGTGIETFYSSKYPNKDIELAKSIQTEMIKQTGMRDRGAKSGNLAVINNTTMAASLVELGFIDTPSDEAKLKDPTFQQKFATAITNGIFNYLSK